MSDIAEDPRSELSRLEMECRGCKHCGGNGLVVVFHPKWSGGRIGMRQELNAAGEWADASFPAEVAAHCSCAVGRWHRDRTDPKTQRRIPWVEDIERGRSRWLLDPPSLDAEPEAHPIPTRGQINEMFRRPA
jgi:hypothetical protein